MQLTDVMTKDVLITTADATVAGAARAMVDRGIGSACVVEDGRLVGIITERDVLQAAASERDLTGEWVRDWMTAEPVTIDLDELPSSVADFLRTQRFRHLPVLRGEELVGMVSMRDVWQFSFLPAEPDDMTLR